MARRPYPQGGATVRARHDKAPHLTRTAAHNPRRGLLLAAVLGTIVLSLACAQGAFAAANATMGPLLQGSSTGAEDYLYTAGNTIFTQATGFKPNPEYRYEVVAPDGTTIKQASSCFANSSPQSDSYTVSAGDAASGASGYRYRIVEFTGTTRVANCGTGTSGVVDDTKFFDVVVPTVDGTSAFSGNQTLFTTNGTAFVKLAAAV